MLGGRTSSADAPTQEVVPVGRRYVLENISGESARSCAHARAVLDPLRMPERTVLLLIIQAG